MRRHKKLYTLLTVLVVTFTMFLQFSCSSEGATRLSETNIVMTAGTNKKLKLRQAKGAVAWSSSNKNIVSVNEKGRIYALKGGTAYIKAKTKKKTYKCKVVVVGFNKEKNEVIVGVKDEIYQKEMYVTDINLLLFDELKEKMKVNVKTRYSSKEESATIEMIDNNTIKVKFENPVARITPGQSAVFYLDDIVVGGGKILK